MKSKADIQVINHGIDGITDMISNNETIDRDDLHHRLYNEDYFIIYTQEAKEFLEATDGGTFDAIEEVQQYEMQNFGETLTEVDPEKMANMYAYIKGEEALNECESYTDAEGELSVKDLEKIKAELEAQI